ncbi:MAG: addiction module toxin, HicA family [Dehalococcoidia bacterium]|nr:addiction module toxin, HicA family [Dehalococcoidia bacterium]MSQ17704.1 addiction module toxin, HicA family [Dehalococcoidia bacterium]
MLQGATLAVNQNFGRPLTGQVGQNIMGLSRATLGCGPAAGLSISFGIRTRKLPNGRRMRGLRAPEVLCALARAGRYESSRSGSHVQLRSASWPGLKVTVPFHGGRDIPLRTVLSVLEQSRLTAEEFEELL